MKRSSRISVMVEGCSKLGFHVLYLMNVHCSGQTIQATSVVVCLCSRALRCTAAV